jgi:Mlc titration factor MtfA (ptsG expression regulator)
VLVTPEFDRSNRRIAGTAAVLTGGAFACLGLIHPVLFAGALLGLPVWWLVRQRVTRRLEVMRRPFLPAWEAILERHVLFYRALDAAGKDRFRQMAQVFLAEVRITGIRTDVDDTVRLLVAASAVIPVFGFHDWDYHRLGEVLIYPGMFDHEYKTEGDGESDRNVLGITGLGHLSGVMILSKPALLAGFDNPSDKENVGIHEFTHAVEQQEGHTGLPPEVPPQVVRAWLAWVARELAHPTANRAHINEYAYTNEHEFLAVLSEYFFESPEVLKAKDPKLYQMLRAMFHQDPASLLSHVPRQKPTYGRNSPCPCGSGKKYKDCCLPQIKESAASAVSPLGGS